MPQNTNNMIAHSFYDGSEFCSISSNRKNVIGVQFHPEKSGEVGLELLRSLIISK